MYDIDYSETSRRGRSMLVLLCVVSAAACVTLSGCATTMPAEDGAGLSARSGQIFGSATDHNRQAHFVAPTPEQKADTYIPPNPARQALALETYETDAVELEPVTAD